MARYSPDLTEAEPHDALHRLDPLWEQRDKTPGNLRFTASSTHGKCEVGTPIEAAVGTEIQPYLGAGTSQELADESAAS